MAVFKSGKQGRPLELDVNKTLETFFDLTPVADLRLRKFRQESKGIRSESILGSQTSLPDWLDESIDLLQEAKAGRKLSYNEARYIKQNLESVKQLASKQARVYERALSEQMTKSYYNELTQYEKQTKSKFTKKQVSEIKTKFEKLSKRERQQVLQSKKYQSPKSIGRYKRVKKWAERDSGRQNLSYDEAWAYLLNKRLEE